MNGYFVRFSVFVPELKFGIAWNNNGSSNVTGMFGSNQNFDFHAGWAKTLKRNIQSSMSLARIRNKYYWIFDLLLAHETYTFGWSLQAQLLSCERSLLVAFAFHGSDIELLPISLRWVFKLIGQCKWDLLLYICAQSKSTASMPDETFRSNKYLVWICFDDSCDVWIANKLVLSAQLQ